MMKQPLAGIKVLDLTRLLPGPFCTQILGDLGADIIKIEEPVGGDYARWYPPLKNVDSGAFISVNRNKKSMKLNLQSNEGKQILEKMILDTDILVEQFRPGIMEKLQIDYKRLSVINPMLIMCSITGFGQDGPYAYKAGHDINYLALTGILDVIGNYKENPVIPGVQIADVGGGSLWATIGILASLITRSNTGKGQYIDVSMTDCVFTFMAMLAGSYFIDKRTPERQAEPLNGGFAWYNIYKTKDDRYLSIGMLEYKFWRKFCKTINREDLIDKQFSPRDIQKIIINDLQEIFITKTLSEWQDIFEPLDICVTRVNTLEEALLDEQLIYREMIIEMLHPVEGRVNSIGFPLKFSNINKETRNAPPSFGEHTEEILQSLGYTSEYIDNLRSKGII